MLEMFNEVCDDFAEEEVRREGRSRRLLRDLRGRPLPRQHLPPARLHRHGVPPHPLEDPVDGGAGTCPPSSCAAWRCCPRGLVLVTGTAGSGKSTTHRLDDQLHQRDRGAPHRLGRGPDRVHLHRPEVRHRPARGRPGHRLVRHGAQARRPPVARRHLHRRNARHRDDGGGDQRGGNRPPGLLHAPLAQRDADRGPHHQLLPAAPPPVPADAAGAAARGRRLAAPAADEGRHLPDARDRAHVLDPDRPGTSAPRENPGAVQGVKRRKLLRLHDVQPVAQVAAGARPDHAGGRAGRRGQPGRAEAGAARHQQGRRTATSTGGGSRRQRRRRQRGGRR